MKICITSIGPDMDSTIDPRFGRCQYFIIADEKGKLIKSIKNTGVRASRGAGITAAQIVADEKVDVLITGNIGPNAFNVLSSSGVKIYSGILNLTTKEAIKKFNKGVLQETTIPTVGGHFGRGLGAGRGRGRGF